MSTKKKDMPAGNAAGKAGMPAGQPAGAVADGEQQQRNRDWSGRKVLTSVYDKNSGKFTNPLVEGQKYTFRSYAGKPQYEYYITGTYKGMDENGKAVFDDGNNGLSGKHEPLSLFENYDVYDYNGDYDDVDNGIWDFGGNRNHEDMQAYANGRREQAVAEKVTNESKTRNRDWSKRMPVSFDNAYDEKGNFVNNPLVVGKKYTMPRNDAFRHTGGFDYYMTGTYLGEDEGGISEFDVDNEDFILKGPSDIALGKIYEYDPNYDDTDRGVWDFYGNRDKMSIAKAAKKRREQAENGRQTPKAEQAGQQSATPDTPSTPSEVASEKEHIKKKRLAILDWLKKAGKKRDSVPVPASSNVTSPVSEPVDVSSNATATKQKAPKLPFVKKEKKMSGRKYNRELAKAMAKTREEYAATMAGQQKTEVAAGGAGTSKAERVEQPLAGRKNEQKKPIGNPANVPDPGIKPEDIAAQEAANAKWKDKPYVLADAGNIGDLFKQHGDVTVPQMVKDIMDYRREQGKPVSMEELLIMTEGLRKYGSDKTYKEVRKDKRRAEWAERIGAIGDVLKSIVNLGYAANGSALAPDAGKRSYDEERAERLRMAYDQLRRQDFDKWAGSLISNAHREQDQAYRRMIDDRNAAHQKRMEEIAAAKAKESAESKQRKESREAEKFKEEIGILRARRANEENKANNPNPKPRTASGGAGKSSGPKAMYYYQNEDGSYIEGNDIYNVYAAAMRAQGKTPKPRTSTRNSHGGSNNDGVTEADYNKVGIKTNSKK